MSLLRGTRRALLGISESYGDRILKTSGLIAYWPLNELSGTIAHCLVNVAQNGTYTGVTLANTPGPGDVGSAPLFDGANDYVNIYSAALAAAFNGAEGTVAIWAKVFDAGTWTDSTTRKALLLRADNNNRIFMHKTDANNDFRHEYRAGGTICGQNTLSMTSTDWVHYALTWSASADEMKSYIAGVQSGATATGLGTWAGTLSDVRSLIGANSNTPDAVWYGWLAHCAVWNTPLSSDQIADLATV